MATIKLTGESEASAGNAADFIYVVQGGATKKLQIGNIAGPFANAIAFSAGLKLGADTDVLDRHKISTWTPTIQGTSTAGGPHTYAVQAGFYVRIGKLTWISCFVQTSALGAAMSGNLQVAGLPFLSANVANEYAHQIIVPYLISLDSGYTWAYGQISPNNNVMLVNQSGSNKSVAGIGVANWGASSGVYTSGLYRAA